MSRRSSVGLYIEVYPLTFLEENPETQWFFLSWFFDVSETSLRVPTG